MNINREILRLSVPAIVSNVTVPLLGLFDTGISGHLGSEVFLAAIAVGSVMLNVVFWLFGFLRMGTTGLTATAYGAGDRVEVRRVFSRAVAIGIVAGFLLIMFQHPLLYILLRVVGADYSIEGEVTRYFLIRIWGAPALLATMAVSGWFVGMQNTVFPLVISVAMNLLNILASFILVYPIGLGFEGVALGTTFSNYLGLLIAFFCCLWFNKGEKLFCRISELWRSGGVHKFFSVNSSLFIRSFCIIMVTLGVTSAGAKLGVMALAVNVVVMQFFQFFSFFMDGFAFSGEALVGLYYGASDREMLRRAVNALLIWALGMAVAFSLIYGIFQPYITSLLTDNFGVRNGVSEVWIFITLIPLVSAWAFIYDGFYVGLTKTGFMMMATLISTLLFFAIILGFPSSLNAFIRGNAIIWVSFLVYLGFRGIILAVLWKRVVKSSLNFANFSE